MRVKCSVAAESAQAIWPETTALPKREGTMQLHQKSNKAPSWSETIFASDNFHFLVRFLSLLGLLEADNLGRLTFSTPTGSRRSNFRVVSLLKAQKTQKTHQKMKSVLGKMLSDQESTIEATSWIPKIKYKSFRFSPLGWN